MSRSVSGYRGALAGLTAAQKPAAGTPAYSRFVNRPVGRRLAAAAHVLRMTPNAVSIVSAAFTFAALALLVIVPPSWVTGSVVALGLAVGYAFDSADGQLARLRGGGSPSGEWLDHMIDATKISTLHLAVLVAMFRFFGLPSPGWLLVPIAYAAVASVTFFGMILIDQIRRNNSGTPVAASPSDSRWRPWLVVPTDYGLLCLVFVLLGRPTIFLGAYTFLLVTNAGFLVLALVKWYRETKALGMPQRRGI
jgi:phosphatidylglycerophosphate synthase